MLLQCPIGYSSALSQASSDAYSNWCHYKILPRYLFPVQVKFWMSDVALFKSTRVLPLSPGGARMSLKSFLWLIVLGNVEFIKHSAQQLEINIFLEWSTCQKQAGSEIHLAWCIPFFPYIQGGFMFRSTNQRTTSQGRQDLLVVKALL